jgi:hypothetical protein
MVLQVPPQILHNSSTTMVTHRHRAELSPSFTTVQLSAFWNKFKSGSWQPHHIM